MKITIVIPVYKKDLSEDEIKSLKQCFNILYRYSVTFVTHCKLDTAVYTQLADETNVNPKFEYFDKEFFLSINSYNRLLLSRDFYSRFTTEDYIFIYQLDGFVFKDELEDWCKRGFDYIGAPWLIHYGRGKYEKSNRLYKVGNGGVSLRRVSAFLERFDRNMPLSVFPFYVKNIRKKKLIPMMIKTLKLLSFLIFSPKTIEYCLLHLTEDVLPEDCFWADALSNTKIALKVPDVTTAASFCFEIAPSCLYQLTDNKLPFACHAYKKYEYESFWEKHIRTHNNGS
ncbi:MAG: hypothetical protein LBR10_08370 [Prevotellaceae bacterium]|nr:hypothetical protein [Prevotellaceae bacterium]